MVQYRTVDFFYVSFFPKGNFYINQLEDVYINQLEDVGYHRSLGPKGRGC